MGKVNTLSVACNLCGSIDFRILYHGTLNPQKLEKRFSQYAYYGDIYRCVSCGFVTQKLLHDQARNIELLSKETYLDELIGKLNVEEKSRQFDWLIRQIVKYTEIDNKKVLDIGANTGSFLEAVKRKTPTAYGIEPSKEAALYCQNRGFQVENAVINNATLENNFFDIVTMWDVVEHLYDPKGDLLRIYSTIRPGGYLFVSTHDFDGLFSMLTGKRYPMLMYQHFYHFSKKTLSKMARSVGFDVVAIQPFFKSWSAGYLVELFGKLWPQSVIAGLIQKLLSPLMKIKFIAKIPIIIPIRNFFILIVRKPG